MAKKIIICGAGIAGVATAYYLLKGNKNLDVRIVDKNQPLSFTTSKSGENFRDYWPQDCMRDFASHSIQLMKELRAEYGLNAFDLVDSGYTFISHRLNNAIFGSKNQENTKDYLEEITDLEGIRVKHPYLDKDVKKIVKIKNAGRIDVYAMGSLLLREAKKLGLKQYDGEILDIQEQDSKFKVVLDGNQSLEADQIILATGPFLNQSAAMLGFQFPIFNTLQRKFIIPDPLKTIPKTMPFTIYADTQHLDWSKEEAAFFASEAQYNWLLQEFPGGLHIKPEPEGIKLGWAFQTEAVEPSWETASFEFFPQAVLKGASRFIPALSQYENDVPTPVVEYAGYYTRTKENWPLIGPTERQNAFVVGALAGFGTMAACAAGQLCSDYVLENKTLPSYAEYFHPLRYESESMLEKMEVLKLDGQL